MLIAGDNVQVSEIKLHTFCGMWNLKNLEKELCVVLKTKTILFAQNYF